MLLFSFQEALRRSAPLDDTLLAAAMEILWRAYRYATDAGVDAWDFAVEIEEFRRKQISHSELRWLLVRGYARHAAETTASGGGRRFRQLAATSLSEASCFIIAEAGLALVESWNLTEIKLDEPTSPTLPMRPFEELAGHASPLTADEKPFWDAKRRKLLISGMVVKQFHCPAASQQLILDAFQAAHWPAHIIDPLPLQPAQCPKRRLHDAIKRLNRGHAHDAIRFCGDGSGRGVLWERLH
jgi:hypothetical protein